MNRNYFQFHHSLLIFLFIYAFASCKNVSGNNDSVPNIFLGIFLNQTLATPSICLKTSAGQSQIDTVINSIQSVYGIQVCMDATLPPIVSASALSSADNTELLQALTQFQTELQRFPVDYVKNWKLQTVYFSKNIKMLGQSVSGLSIGGSSLVIYELYVTASYRQLLIHHEIFHHLDSLHSGIRIFYDDVWDSYNVRGNLYDGSYASCSAGGGSTAHPMTGFLNNYSFCSMTEDKAEVYSLQFNGVTNTAINNYISEGDTVLQKKVNHVRKMAGYFSPNINLNFWNTLNP